jgi:fructose-1,6-bisphosphatase/inositol monophosphatase family enzyme
VCFGFLWEAHLASATLDLAYVASGAFDIWWEGGCWEWLVSFVLYFEGYNAEMKLLGT